MGKELHKNHNQEPRQKFHLWLVDNELHHREMFPLYTQQHGGFTVRTFASPEALLAALNDPREQPPDAFGLDYKMGNTLNGLELANKIKQSPYYNPEQIIFLLTDLPLKELADEVEADEELKTLYQELGPENVFDKGQFYPHTLDLLQRRLESRDKLPEAHHILMVETDSAVKTHADEWAQALGPDLDLISISNPSSVLKFLEQIRGYQAAPTLIAINHNLKSTISSFELAADIRLFLAGLPDTPIVIYTEAPELIANHPAIKVHRLEVIDKSALASYLHAFAQAG